MRRTILFGLFALLTLCAANDARAQRHTGPGSGFVRHGIARAHARAGQHRGFGYAYLPYDSGDAYDYAPPPEPPVERPPVFIQQPAPPVVKPPGPSVITEYKWSAAELASSSSPMAESQALPFGIVLKDGSTISAVSVFTSDDGLHYVDPDARHLRVSMSMVDRAATLKLNRDRNLNLYLPAAQ